MTEPAPAELLAFEARMPGHNGAKEEAIRAELHLTPSRYYVLLLRIINTYDAARLDPALVRRLRADRDRIAAAHNTHPPTHT